MNRSRTYFSVFLAVVILVVSFYFSMTFFSGKKSFPATSIAKIVSSGNTPKFAETGVGTGQGGINVTKSIADDLSAEFYKRIEGLDAQKRDDLFAQIKAGDKDALSLDSLDPQQIVKKISPDAIGIRTSIPDTEIQLDSENNLSKYQKRYLLAMTDVQLLPSQVDPTQALNDFINKADASGLDKMIEAHQNAYAALQDVPVPSSALVFHKKNLLYLSNSVAAYTALRAYTTDPLRAYIAIEYIGSLANLWSEIYQETSS